MPQSPSAKKLTPEIQLALASLTTSLPVVMGIVPKSCLWVGAAFVLLSSPLLDLALKLTKFERLETAGEATLRLSEKTSQILFTIFSFALIVSFLEFVATSSTLTTTQLLCGIFSWALIGGIPGLIAGHALIHDRKREFQMIGQGVFIAMNYSWFPYMHLHMHHRHVASPEDLHSAPKGRSFYRFLIRGMIGEIKLAIRAVQSPKTPAKIRKQLRVSAALQTILVLLVAACGIVPLLTMLVSGFLMTSVVWLVNYVQHYGLSKKTGAHSWDVGYRSTNLLFFNAGLHSDHHESASKEIGRLRLARTQLFPFNFPGILIVALVPKFYFRSLEPHLIRKSEENLDADLRAPKIARAALVRVRSVIGLKSTKSHKTIK